MIDRASRSEPSSLDVLTATRHVLIDGTFDTRGAADVLLELVDFKILYHMRRNFSLEERFGETDRSSEQRIEELRKTRQTLVEVLRVAEEDGQALEVRAEIQLRPVSMPVRR